MKSDTILLPCLDFVNFKFGNKSSVVRRWVFGQILLLLTELLDDVSVSFLV